MNWIKNSILIILVGISGVICAQKAHVKKGDEFFRKRLYLEAIAEYEIALEQKIVFDKFKMTKRIAQTHKMLFDYEKANEWYAKLVAFKDEDEPVHLFDHALILCNLEKYEEAKKSFEDYFKLIEKPEKIKTYTEICDWAIKNKDKTANVAVAMSNLETGGRSIGLDFYDKGLVYSKPQNNDFISKTVYYDLATTNRLDTAKFDSSKVLPGNLNHMFYEGTPSFNKSETELYYTGNASEVTKYRDRKVKKKGIPLSSTGLNILHIYHSKKVNGKWINGKALSINNKEYDCVFPYINDKEDRLYFVSNMPGGYGGFDLYYADKVSDTTWSDPVNLGANINSELDEMYPYIDEDTLYYSSKGKKGFGGADIYKSYFNGKLFGEAKNLGKPYNSSKDDFSFIINNEDRRGYFSSNREGVNGYDRIYEFNIAEDPDTIRGIALNKITENPISGIKVRLHRVNEKGVPEFLKEYITNADGKVELILEKHLEFFVTFDHPGFDSQTFEIPAEDRADVVAKFGLILFMPIPKKDDVIKIDNIYFDYNKSTIKEESFEVLDVIVEYLKKNSTIRVELSAHTDSRGSDSYNLRLSSKRAASAVGHLIEKGIDKSRLIPKGYGEKKLVNKCANKVECTEEEHQENRRVELKVL